MTGPILQWVTPGGDFPDMFRTRCGRYAIIPVVLPENPPRTVFSVRRRDDLLHAIDPTRGDLGYHIGESPWLTFSENRVSSAHALAEQHAWFEANAEYADTPNTLPAAVLRRFFWPAVHGIARGGLAIVREGKHVYARVTGQIRDETAGSYQRTTLAEIELTQFGIPADLFHNTSDHSAEGE